MPVTSQESVKLAEVTPTAYFQWCVFRCVEQPPAILVLPAGVASASQWQLVCGAAAFVAALQLHFLSRQTKPRCADAICSATPYDRSFVCCSFRPCYTA